LSDSQSLHCNACSRVTKHVKLASHTEHGQDEETPIDWTDVYSILRCGGCSEITLLHENFFSEHVEWRVDQHGEPYQFCPPTVKTYPPRLARPLPAWIDAVKDDKIEKLIVQVYVALQNDSRWLATMGTRTLLELAMTRVVPDQGTFTGTVRKFVAEGHLAPKMESVLTDALEPGHAAAHRGYEPDVNELINVLDVVEAVLMQIFVLPERAAAMKAATPRRPPRP
jgi:uncharacterized protein DUF4145